MSSASVAQAATALAAPGPAATLARATRPYTGLNCLTLAAAPCAARSARRHVRKILGDWGRGELVDSAELVVSELVTNALQATERIADPPGWGELRRRLTVVCLSIYPHDRGIVVEVWDRSKLPPVRRSPSADDESGRGLELVTMLSTRWGYRWPKTGGKWVWAVLHC